MKEPRNEAIKKALRKAGVTYHEVGEFFGVHANTIGRWLQEPETGENVQRIRQYMKDNQIIMQ